MLRFTVLMIGVLAPTTLRAQVVVNEILYHAPDDDANTLEWIELYNSSDDVVSLSGWKITDGVEFAFPADAKLLPHDYALICKDEARFRTTYAGVEPMGSFEKSLGNSGDTVTLLGEDGEVVDRARYTDGAPWAVSADGYSASLERIVPGEDGSVAAAWAPSPLDPSAPGTPGQKNANHSANPPPIIDQLELVNPSPGAKFECRVRVRDADGVGNVTLVYAVVDAKSVSDEERVEMVRMTTPNDVATHKAMIPALKHGCVLRYRVEATDESGTKSRLPHENALRPMRSVFVGEQLKADNIPLVFFFHTDDEARANADQYTGRPSGFRSPYNRKGQTATRLPPRGNAIMVVQEPGEQTPLVFDYIHITPRSAGYKVRFHRDHRFRGISTINVIFEVYDRFVLAEYLAYDLYRRTGMPSPRADFCRLVMGDRVVGYHLMFEQPNQSFLRHNGVTPGGNLYKLLWYGRTVEGQHEKKNNFHLGHSDLFETLEAVNGATGQEQWEVIEQRFNVEEVINYFAVNTVLSHWDGFFNNYFAYHDPKTDKWEMYPWDQDKTWGYYDNILPGTVFYNMPITFGMNGDRPPRGFRGFFGAWWRPGGHFSGPLLANETFRQRFLERTKAIVDELYTEEVYFPVIDQLAERLRPEVAIRANGTAVAATYANAQFEANIKSLKTHLSARRKFLLEEEEIKALTK